MPTYEYQCTDCSHQFEEFQSITADPITVCPSCSGKTQRIISGGAGLIFKGSGFYITDNRSSNYKKDAAKETTKDSVPGKSGEPKTSSDSGATGDTSKKRESTTPSSAPAKSASKPKASDKKKD